MPQLVNAISAVTGPLTLIAFLALVVLEIYRRSVNDKRGLEYVYKLYKEKLTRNQFYNISKLIINRVFVFVLVVFIILVVSFVVTQVLAGQPA